MSKKQKKTVVEKQIDPGIKDQNQVPVVLPAPAEVVVKDPVKLKVGAHDDLPEDIYEIHGATAKISGRVFIAGLNVNWIPVTKCVCKITRSRTTEIRRSLNGSPHQVTLCYCDNVKECMYHGLYVYVHTETVVKT